MHEEDEYYIQYNYRCTKGGLRIGDDTNLFLGDIDLFIGDLHVREIKPGYTLV